MPRQARLLSETGMYHVLFEGVNHGPLFEETEDYERFLARLTAATTELSLQVMAYCLMPHHVHLLVKEQSPGDITRVMRKTLTPYARWFNKQHARSGPLIANRYKSEGVAADDYLLAVLRHIHRNPVEAGITARIDGYPWSSYPSYTTGLSPLTDTDVVLGLFSPDRATALARFAEFHQDATPTASVRLFPQARPDDLQVRTVLATAFDGLEPAAIPELSRTRREAVIGYLRSQGFSVRQIERVTGVSRGIVARIPAAQSAEIPQTVPLSH